MSFSRFRRSFYVSRLAIDETNDFIHRNSYTNVCDFANQIIRKLVNPEECYYKKVLIIRFAGTKSKKWFPYGRKKSEGCTLYKFYPEVSKDFNSKDKVYLDAPEIFKQTTLLDEHAEPIGGDGNQFLLVLVHLLQYLEGLKIFAPNDSDFAKIAARKRASLLIVSDMNFLSLEKGKFIYH